MSTVIMWGRYASSGIFHYGEDNDLGLHVCSFGLFSWEDSDRRINVFYGIVGYNVPEDNYRGRYESSNTSLEDTDRSLL